jgi:DNA invertase Pin-like site-specific DNA recombinase
MSKLTTDAVREIRRLANSGMSYAEIGRRFSISDVHAGRIATRVSWSHIL